MYTFKWECVFVFVCLCANQLTFLEIYAFRFDNEKVCDFQFIKHSVKQKEMSSA